MCAGVCAEVRTEVRTGLVFIVKFILENASKLRHSNLIIKIPSINEVNGINTSVQSLTIKNLLLIINFVNLWYDKPQTNFGFGYLYALFIFFLVPECLLYYKLNLF